jgi:hypothetical protein
MFRAKSAHAAHRWQQLLDDGKHRSAGDIARISTSSGRGFASAQASPPFGAMITLRPPLQHDGPIRSRRLGQVHPSAWNMLHASSTSRLPMRSARAKRRGTIG